jgi:hypothetical protein
MDSEDFMFIHNTPSPRLPDAPRPGKHRTIAGAGRGGAVADTVTAVYVDRSAHSFVLPERATLGDLAAQLSDWGQGHGGSPLYVRVTFWDREGQA